MKKQQKKRASNKIFHAHIVVKRTSKVKEWYKKYSRYRLRALIFVSFFAIIIKKCASIILIDAHYAYERSIK